jgi:hypothetical protein
MKRNAGTLAALTAVLLVGESMGGCGGRLTTTEMGETTGPGGAAGTGGAGGVGGATGGTGGSTGGTDGGTSGTGGTGDTGGTGGVGGATGGVGGTGGATGGTGGTGGATGGTGGGGKGGTGGAGGKGGTGGAGGGTIQCGRATCSPIVSPLGTLPACCPVGEMNACGAQVAMAGNICLTATPGTANPRCPAVQVVGQMLPGCCRPNGLCGVNLQIAGLGCNDPTPLGGAPPGPCNGAL